jgi:hypothetical protein
MNIKLTRQKFLTLFGFSIVLLSAFGAFAQVTGDKKPPQKRVALVIGNAAYTKAKPLPNAANDAEDMAKALREQGFEVTLEQNLTRMQMQMAVRALRGALRQGGVGVFYYAGHAVQTLGNRSFLLGVDADITKIDDIAKYSLNFSFLVNNMSDSPNELNIFILDANRKNPFPQAWLNNSIYAEDLDGLAKEDPPEGLLLFSAAEPGKAAPETSGRNGLFTETLLRYMKQPNLKFKQFVDSVTAEVRRKSNNRQTPWFAGNSLVDFSFAGGGKTPGVLTGSVPNAGEPGGERQNDALRLANTRWTCYRDADDYKKFDVWFLASGRFNYQRILPTGSPIFDNGRWQVTGDQIRLSYNNDYAVDTGTISSNRIQATGGNVVGLKWTMRCVKQ